MTANLQTQKIQGYYQSPTGNTKRLVEGLCQALSALGTLGALGTHEQSTLPPLTIVGVPVYAGRVPNLMLPWLQRLGIDGDTAKQPHAHKPLAVAVVTYGGRHYDDALIELCDLLEQQGYLVIGAGAFVAPHSFDKNLVPGRPNPKDEQELQAFSRAIYAHWSLYSERSLSSAMKQTTSLDQAASLDPATSLDLASLGLGKRPYRPYLQPKDEAGLPIDFKRIKPAVDYQRCTRCGICVASCSHGSIPSEAPHTTTGKCTKCHACVRVCPEEARKFIDLGFLWHLHELKGLCSESAPNVWTTGVRLMPLALPEDVARYGAWIKGHYAEDPLFIDYNTPVLAEFYEQKTKFSKHLTLQGYWLFCPGIPEPVGAVTFLVHKAYGAALQVVFMEYGERLDLAHAIVEAAKRQAKAWGQGRIVFGLCGHVNYGLGLSVNPTHRASFGAPYSKAYYATHLQHVSRGAAGWVQKGLTSYHYPWSASGFPMPEGQIQRLERRSAGKLTCRAANVHRFAFSRGDMALYTALNNACFTRHDYYFPRDPQEDLDLFSDLRHFMVPGSLIFAYLGDTPVGFLLWYPDWSEQMKPGETLGIGTYLKLMVKGLLRRPGRFKIVEWAVLPEHAKRGIPIALLKACEAYIRPYRFKSMVTSWILDENRNSNTFARHWAKPYEHYAAFRLDLLDSGDAPPLD